MCVVEPQGLRSTVVENALKVLLPDDNMAALAGHLGFDPMATRGAVVASYPASTLVLMDVPHDASLVEQKLKERFTTPPQRLEDARGVVTISGAIGLKKRTLSFLYPNVLAWETGAPLPLRAAIAFSEEKLKRSKPALYTEPLRSLAPHLGNAPFQVMAPAPPAHTWSGAHGLLQRTLAIGLSAQPTGEWVTVKIAILGEWDDPPTEALRRLNRTLDDIAASPVGKLTGLNSPSTPWSFEGDKEVLRASAAFDPNKVAAGLRAATTAQIREIVGP